MAAATHLKAKANNVVRGLRVLAAEDPCMLLLELLLVELDLGELVREPLHEDLGDSGTAGELGE